MGLEESCMFQWLYSNEITAGSLLTIVSLLLILVISGFSYLARKQQKLQQKLLYIQNEIRAINSGNLGMGRKINKFAEDIANVEISHLSDQNEHISEKTYQQAGLLLERGATIDEVVDACDMSPAEVELLAILRHSGAAA